MKEEKAGNSIQLTKLADCAGCAAKVGAGELSGLLSGLRAHDDPNLLVGFERSDDASVYRVSDTLALVQTVDFFPPVADDPYLFGQIAAANALSDVYAMGGEPKLAQNVMCVPEDMDKNAVREILRGGCDKVFEAGALITGGHSIFDKTPKYGLCVTGFVHPDKVLTNCGARPGDVLILSKPLGMGILGTALKAELLSKEAAQQMYELMTTLNRGARDVMIKYEVHACTDVTGFGLLGHLLEMAQGSKVTAVVDTAALPVLPGAEGFAAEGLNPAGLYRNRRYAGPHVTMERELRLELADVLFDPQTSGGLLMAVAEADAEALKQELSLAAPCAAIIGRICPADGAEIRLV